MRTESGSLSSGGGTATCDSNEVATGGGFFISDDDYVASASMPSGNGWNVKINKLPRATTTTVTASASAVAAAPRAPSTRSAPRRADLSRPTPPA
ncbi:hypothetical protein ACFQX6_46075 [Streptosporangium lutulentum]